MAWREEASFGDVKFEKFNGQSVPTSATFTIAAGAANVAGITIQLKDSYGSNLDSAVMVNVWVSGAATGLSLGTAPSTGFAATTGVVLHPASTKQAIQALTDATGKLVLTLTDTSKTTSYIAVGSMLGGIIGVSSQLATGSYGS